MEHIPDAPWIGLCKEDYENIYCRSGKRRYEPDEGGDCYDNWGDFEEGEEE